MDLHAQDLRRGRGIDPNQLAIAGDVEENVVEASAVDGVNDTVALGTILM